MNDGSDDGAVVPGQNPGEIVLIDAAYGTPEGVQLFLEVYQQVDGGDSPLCTSEAEMVEALVAVGAGRESAERSAHIVWKRESLDA